ncbi:hypothetical protein [Ralstonia pseudosolanacearum]|uniref:hypothetical protein n=1 Tax=Ralstonia pseudosolanacearum TaxID=1310165 RepID=UPI003CF81671
MPMFDRNDVVRVKPNRLSSYLKAFADRVRDRQAVVDKESSTRPGAFWVVFQKRAGRGKEFRELLVGDDLELISRGGASDGRQNNG